MSSNVLAVVPARGGSKRLPRKNVRELDGEPLVAHAISHGEAAIEVDKTVVSTEDDEIRKIAVEYGSEDPIDRPNRLASDTATVDEVVRHVIQELGEQGEQFDIVCALLPTTPFREPEDINKSVQRLDASDAQSIVSVTNFDHPPLYAVDETDDGFLQPYFGEEYLWSITRSQEMPSLMRPNGVVFAAETDALIEYENFYTDKTLGYKMPPERSIDIDNSFDLKIARAIINYESEK